MKIDCARRQRGVVLIAMLAVIMLAATWMLLSQLNAGSAGIDAARKAQNAAVLQRAKLALIGYVGAQAVKTGENNPGAIPCPEAPASFNATNGTDGKTNSAGCTGPVVGRFPWRTIGTEKLVDASGEPLWLVISAGWSYDGTNNTVINSNSVGQLTVDGVANDAVALIIAPGPAFSAAASTSPVCAAKSQSRPATGSPDWSNYLECENATYPTVDANFVTTGPSASFNDQVTKITVADIMPAIEAGIASRIESEIAPKLLAVYATTGATGAVGGGGAPTYGGTAALLPLAMGFSNPDTNALASSTTSTQGLLPLSYAEGGSGPGSGAPCTPGVATAPDWCAPNFVRWTLGSTVVATAPALTTYSNTCTVATTTYTTLNCTYRGTRSSGSVSTGTFVLSASASNVGAALRQFKTNATGISGFNTAATAWTVNVNSSGTANVTASGTYTSGALDSTYTNCGISFLIHFFFGTNCFVYTLSVPIFVFADHPTVHDFLTGGSPDTTWFLRNKWHVVSYYAVAAGMAPGGTNSCATGTTCLNVAYHRNSAGVVDAGAQRAILVLAGMPLTGQSRSGSSTLSNWLEGDNANGDNTFEVRSATLLTNRTFNDRVAVISTN
jgi:hypothetical protein